jgi:hypothetical protein
VTCGDACTDCIYRFSDRESAGALAVLEPQPMSSSPKLIARRYESTKCHTQKPGSH